VEFRDLAHSSSLYFLGDSKFEDLGGWVLAFSVFLVLFDHVPDG